MIEVREISPRHEAVQALIKALDEYLSALYPAESNHLDSVEDLEKDTVYFIGAFDNGNLVGCGAVKLMPGDYGEIKRMYVISHARGKGIAKIMMDALESFLLESNILVSRLETGIHQKEAIALYTKRGYKRVSPFGTYRDDPLSVFMEKRLDLPNTIVCS
jgi:putative acetyltransferase